MKLLETFYFKGRRLDHYVNEQVAFYLENTFLLLLLIYNIVQWICPGLLLSFILSIYTLQSSRDKLERYFILSSRLLKTIFLLSICNHNFVFPKNKPIIASSWIARFVRETVAESSIPVGEIAKVEWCIPNLVMKLIRSVGVGE